MEHVFPDDRASGRCCSTRTAWFRAKARREQLILLAIEDITVRKRAERLRQETEDRLRTMVDTAVDAIITIDEHGTINSINAATERMFGYPAAELIGQNVKMLMPPPYREEHDGYLARYLQTGEKHIIGIGREVQGRRKDGTTFPVDLAVSEFEDRGQQHVHRRPARPQRPQGPGAGGAGGRRPWNSSASARSCTTPPAQELTALGLLAESLVAALKEESPAEAGIATKMAEGLQRVLGQVRAISRGLIRVEVDAEGLMAALAELAAQTTELHGVTCTFDCQEPVHLADNQTATQLYCIAREAVTNALKHAQARNITISLESEDQSVTLRVRGRRHRAPGTAARYQGEWA